MLEFLAPVERFGHRFDRGMILFEMSALREPERTQFPLIGAWLRERVPMVEVPCPSMLWRKKIVPDLFISNQLDAVPEGFDFPKQNLLPSATKQHWPNDYSLERASRIRHGDMFHETFIEPFCRKITGRSSSEIAAKYHRAVWLPLYWPQTLRARQSIRTPFWYPAEGYAGVVGRAVGNNGQDNSGSIGPDADERQAGRHHHSSPADSVSISVAFALVEPRQIFSVAMVVDDSPIYRITNMDATNALCPHEQRWVIEYRGECNVPMELERLQLGHYPQQIAYDSFRMTLPTIANVKAGWKPRPNVNQQLMEVMRAETSA